MAEAAMDTRPLESEPVIQIKNISMQGRRNPSWDSPGQKCLLLLMGLTMLGLLVERYLIYSQLNRIETFLCQTHNLCEEMSSRISGNQTWRNSMSSQDEPQNEFMEIPAMMELVPQMPLAWFTGTETLQGEDNVVQWKEDTSDSLIRNMGYSKGRLTIKMKGYYYLYSKLTLDASEECSLIQHKVVRRTKDYDGPIILMRAKSVRCGTQRRQNSKPSEGPVVQNSFLAGIFHLDKGDEIYVTLEDIKKIIPGRVDNMIGAFMISS